MKTLFLTLTVFFLLFFNRTGLAQNNIPVNKTGCIKSRFKLQLLGQNDSLKRMRIYFAYGTALDDEGEYELAKAEFEKALKIAVFAKKDSAIVNIANYIGNEYVMLGDFEQANKSYLCALNSAKKIGDSGEIAKISMNLAGNYNLTGNYDTAISYGLYALQTKEKAKNITRICYHYVTVGNIFNEIGDTAKWEEYIMKAYKMKDVKGCSNFGDIAKIYNGLGGIAKHKGNLEQALLYYDTLQKISKEAGFFQGISTALTNSADIYKQKGNYQKALKMLISAEQYFGQNPYEQIFNTNLKAELYKLTGAYNKALELARKNISNKAIKYYSAEKLKTLELLYALNASLANYKEALVWSDSVRMFENKLRNQEVVKTFEELEMKYETKKKEHKIQLLETEHEIYDQRIRMGIFLIVGFILVILLGVYVQRLNKLKSEYREALLQQQLYRVQMNPHFIFNALASIQGFMLKNQSEKVAYFLGKFASIARLVLEYSAQESIPLSKEIEILQNYIEIEKMRAQDSFSYVFELDENMETEFIHVPPMALQPFVENAIKHGLKEQENGRLYLSFHEKENNILKVIIEDNGPGINFTRKDKREHHRSMAMEIFEKRRKLWQKRNKKALNLNVVDLSSEGKTGTRVTVELPVLT